MKFSCNRESLIEALKKLRPFVSSRSFLPILQNVRVVTFAKDQVMLTTTNLDVRASMTVAAEVKEVGETTLPFSLLASVLGEMSGERVTFKMGAQDSKKERTVISSGLAESALIGMDAREFPEDPFAETAEMTDFKVHADWLKPRLSRVLFAALNNDSRPVLNTVLWKVTGRDLTLVATDGFRLAIIDEPDAFGLVDTPHVQPKKDFTVLLPTVSLTGILQLLEGEVTVTLNCQRVKFATQTATVVVSVPDYDFPDYSPILPKRHLHRMQLERARAIAAARLALVIAQEDSSNKAVTLRVMTSTADAQKGTLVMSAKVSAVGANEARAELGHMEGNKFDEMGVNGGYLLEALLHAPDGDIVIETVSPADPIVVKSINDATWMCIVMPIHQRR